MKKLLLILGVVVLAVGVQLATGARANANVTVNPGDLIRGQAFSAVYYMGSDGFRYVFPNTKTYNTWYSNFDSVKFISDAQLGDIQIGGNVTYRPGVRMIKVQSDPRTYAVGSNGELRHIASEAAAIGLYGSNWNKMIDDVPDAFFGNYRMGTAITNTADFDKATVTASASSINVDKSLSSPTTVTLTATSYSPASITIPVGGVVRFTNSDSANHTATADDLTWGSGTLMPGKSFLRKFNKAGVYTFFDSYNSQATGTITVQ